MKSDGPIPINDSWAALSKNSGFPANLTLMSKPGTTRSVLYRLIEAGQLTHKALLVPLIERGLEPGDDAVLFLLADKMGATEVELIDGSGITAEALAPRIARLMERDLIEQRAVGPQLIAGYGLTERGARIREVLAENWQELELALLGELKPKKRKDLREALGRFVDLLRL